MLKKKNIYLMYAIACLQGMVFYGPIATLYRQAAGITIFQITAIESICLALTVLFELPWGIVADKIGYRWSMIICCILYFISKIIFWKAEDFSGFLAERVLLSIVCAGLSGVDTNVLYLSCEEGESHKVFGIYNNLGTVGLLFAAGTYSVMIGDNYRLAGFLTVISYGVCALLAFGLEEVKIPQRIKKNQVYEFWALLRQTLTNKRLLLLVIAAALLSETHQTITVFLNQLQYVKAGMSSSHIAMVYVAITCAGLLGGLSARLTGKLGAKRTGIAMYIFCIAACLALSLSYNAVISVAAVLLLRISFSFFQPLQMKLQNQEIKSENRATALSLNAVIMDFVAISTNLIFGSIAEINLSVSMLFGSMLCGVGLVLYVIRYRCSR